MQEINKSKHQNNKDVLEYIKSLKPPFILELHKARLITLLNYFQKKFVFKPMELYFNDIKIQLKQQELNHILFPTYIFTQNAIKKQNTKKAIYDFFKKKLTT